MAWHPNGKLLFQLLVYGVVISFFISRLAKYDLVKGYWRGITFKPTGNDGYQFNRYNILSYIDNFFSFNQINPRNYVGLKIKYVNPSPRYTKNNIYNQGYRVLSGLVIDRIAIKKKIQNNKGIKHINDPHWFVLQVTKNEIEDVHDFLIFKFIRPFDEISNHKHKDVMVYSPQFAHVLSKPEIDLADFKFEGMAGIIQES